jgi:predicted anti-sigma-YlaC factor YlaD
MEDLQQQIEDLRIAAPEPTGARMKHCLSPEMWTGFLDGALSREAENKAETHLAACAHCRLLATEFVRVEDVLTGAARQAKERAALAPSEIRLALDRFHAQIHEPRGITCCLEALRFFLTGMLGASAGGKVIQAAAKQAEITEAAWPGFIVRLSGMIGDLCGDGAGAIVAYIGNLAEPALV